MLGKLLLLTVFVSTATAMIKLKYDVASFNITQVLGVNKDVTVELNFTVSKRQGKLTPAIYISSIAGNYPPSSVQSDLVKSITDDGWAWIAISKIRSPNAKNITNSLALVIDWLTANAASILKEKVPGVTLDMDNQFTLIGHSAGGYAVVEYLKHTCGQAKMLVLLDPVDGVDPFGIKRPSIITPGKMLPFAVPTLLIMNELDNTSASTGKSPCAPANASNQVFYEALSGPKWLLNFTQYGHLDFWNTGFHDIAKSICATCTKNCNYTLFRYYVSQAILSFSYSVFFDDDCAREYIEHNKWDVITYKDHNYMGYDVTKGGFCKRVSNEEKPFSMKKNEGNLYRLD